MAGSNPVLLIYIYTHLRQFCRPALDRNPQSCALFLIIMLLYLLLSDNENNNKTVNSDQRGFVFIEH